MNVITRENMAQFVVSGEFSIPSNVEGKNSTLSFIMDKVPVSSIIASSLKDKRINAQVKLRAKPESYKEGQIVKLAYTGGKVQMTGQEVILAEAEAKGMTVEEYLKAELVKLEKK